MKLPNGYGSVSKLSGKRRNPWRVRKTVDGKRITVGCFATKQEALQALADYNADPYDLSSRQLTFGDVYMRWSEEHFQNIVPSAIRTWKSAYKYCDQLHEIPMRDVRVMHLEQTIRDAQVGDSTKARIKSLFNLMYKYALKHEIVDKDYAALCSPVKQSNPTIVRKPFTEEEIQTLWNNLDFPFVDMILIGIYSGWRPAELATLLTDNVDLVERTMKGGLKTNAGRNRIVPIHSKIYDLVQNRYKQSSEHVFADANTYDKYRRRFERAMKHLSMHHTMHDTRHTFITNAKNADVDEYLLKLIVGHAIHDVTEKVYTHRTMEDLRREIEKIQ